MRATNPCALSPACRQLDSIDNLDEGLRRIAASGIIGQFSTEETVREMTSKTPLTAHIPVSIMRDDGFTSAIIGSVEDDLDGRTIH